MPTHKQRWLRRLSFPMVLLGMVLIATLMGLHLRWAMQHSGPLIVPFEFQKPRQASGKSTLAPASVPSSFSHTRPRSQEMLS
jgi:hypothetical protein